MKKTLFQLVVISSVVIFASGCKSSVDKIGVCLKKSANTFMMKGHKATEEELGSLCSEFEGSLKGSDMEEKRKALELLDTVKKHIEEKRLFTDVEDVKLPEITSAEEFVKELAELNNDKLPETMLAEKIMYYFKNRQANWKMVVADVDNREINGIIQANNEGGRCFIASDIPTYDIAKYYRVDNGNILVKGFRYDDSKVDDIGIQLLIPEKEKEKILQAKRTFKRMNNGNACIEEQTDLKKYKQIIKFTGTVDDIKFNYNATIAAPVFKTVSYEFITPQESKDVAKNKNGEPIFYFGASDTPKETATETETKSETKVEETPKAKDNVLGLWNGKFGNDELKINIESIDANGAVKGYDEVKGNKRTLKGNKNENSFTLSEPGDDKWDGVFTFKYDPNGKTLTGEWKANNGKSSKQFTLTKN